MSGLIHIYCGDGKGKSTAALGLAMRFAGYGKKAVVAQFQKTEYSGELTAAEHIPHFLILRVREDGVSGFAWNFTDREKQIRAASHRELLARAVESCAGEESALLVLDEIISAFNFGLIDKNCVLELLRQKPENMELVLTGRDPAPEICAFADYITEMKAVRHPMEQGVPARKGIEF